MRSFKLLLASSVGLVAMAAALPTMAQQQPTPPEHYTLDARGVDLVQGTFNYSTTDVTIGNPGAGGLSFGRIWTNGGWRDSLSGTIAVSGSTYVVSLGGESEVFTLSGGVYTPVSNTGATLTQSGGLFTFTLSGGTVATYTTTYSGSTSPYNADNAALTTITQPNGEVTTLSWGGVTYCFDRDLDGNCVEYRNAVRVNAVSNNRGYLIKFAYGMDATPYDYAEAQSQWLRRVSVTGVNLAVDYCTTGDGPCTGLTRTWPSATYASGDFGGSITTVTDQSGRVTTYGYTSGPLDAIRYPGSVSDDVTVSYASGKVSGVTDASGAWTYGYSDVGTTRTTTTTGPLSQSMTVVSDLTIGRATSVSQVVSTGPTVSQTTAYAYDGQRRLDRITNPEGDYTQLTYDARGNVTQTTAVPKSGSGLSNIVTSATYAGSCVNPVTCNLPTSTTDARGYQTDYVWNSTHGGLESVTSPAPSGSTPVGSGTRPQTRITYAAQTAYYKNSSGVIVAAPSSVTLPTATSTCVSGSAPSCLGTADELKTTVVYGSSGVANNLLPTSTTSGDGAGSLAATTAMTWTPDGDPLTVDGPLSGTGDTTMYRYDNARQVVGVVGPDPDGGGALLNRAMRMTYNSRGQVTLTEQGTTAGYTDPNWAAFSTLQRQAVTYDGYGRPVTQASQDAGGTSLQLVQQSYDSAGRPECTTVRMNPSAFGSLPGACTMSAPSYFGPDRITYHGYDAAGRPNYTGMGWGTASAKAETVTYTPNGLPQDLTDSNGYTSIMEYDAFDRLYRLRYPNPLSPGTSTTDYQQYTYDIPLNTVTYRTRAGQDFVLTADNLNRQSALTAPVAADSVSYTYDLAGRRLTAATSSQTLTNVWDGLSRLTSETGPLGTMSYQYDIAGRRTRQTWPDAFYVTNSWNLADEMTAILQGGSTQIVAFGYDNLGRRTSLTRGNGVNSSYTYDGISRLASLSHDLIGSSDDVTFTYSYNPASQILTRNVSNSAYVQPAAASNTAYANNGLNQVTTIGGAGVSYDSNGNITNDTTRSFTYDAANRLTGNGAGSTLSYDPLGRLHEYVGTSGAKYLYDGIETAGVAVSGTTLANRFVHGPRMNEILAGFSTAGPTPANYWSEDERGSLVAITNGSTGATTGINTYDEYGVPASGNLGRYQYTGQLWLPDFGSYHYRARAYQPGIGRFLQTDPIGYAAGMNLYAYVGADPVNLVDPLGLCGDPKDPNDPPCEVGEVVVTPCAQGSRYNRLLRTCTPAVANLPTGFGLSPGAPSNGGQNASVERRCSSTPPLSAGEIAAVNRGDRVSYWRSRAARGDAAGRASLNTVRVVGMGIATDSMLRLGMARRDLMAGRSQTAGEINAEIHQIGIELMQAHAALVATGQQITPSMQAQYHHRVFDSHGLPRNTFGGTPFLGLVSEANATASLWLSCD